MLSFSISIRWAEPNIYQQNRVGRERQMVGNPIGWAHAIDSQQNGVGPPLPIPNGMGWAHQSNVWQSNGVGPGYRFPREWGGPTATD
jgi:hypothetical protein